jgi:HD-GYP domain-containing protein (c-di-GMP phosphodiesterase class II)
MQKNQPGITDLRKAEVIAALSLAIDLGMGQPMETFLCSCVLSMRLGEALGLSENELGEVYYLSLLRHVGCNVEAPAMAAFVGDEIAMRATLATEDWGHPTKMMGALVRHFRQVNEDITSLQLARIMAQGMWGMMRVVKDGSRAVCEVAQRLAERLGFGEDIRQALFQNSERWDGRGLPNGIKGEDIRLSVRVVALAHDAILFHRMGGVEAAIAVAKERKGGAYDPRIVECFCRQAPQLLSGLEEEPSWESVLALEPGSQDSLSETQFDTACRAIADFTDIKTPYTLDHSSGVAELAALAARQYGLSETEAVSLRRAGMLHDVGRTAISGGIWAKPGPLTEREWERVRMHSYYTERVLARPAILARLGAIASLHHERLDGSGYHRGAPATLLQPVARILAAADAYHAMTEPRPHRAVLSPEAAAEQLKREVRAGRIDSDAANAVLAAAGHRVRHRRRELVAGLSEREVEVLRLVARGHSQKEIAQLLVISQKTVDHHIQHIYTKIGVSTRAAATLFAMQHDLLADVL